MGIPVCIALLFLSCVAASKYPCPCKDPKLCETVDVQYQYEVFAFGLRDVNWPLYGWDKITTIAVFGDQHDPQLMCHAHSVKSRIVLTSGFSVNNVTNATWRSEWIKEQVETVQRLHYDGINVDFEGVISKENVTQRDALTTLMKDLTTAAKAAVPGAQISFDVAWSPDGIDVRIYDYVALADACDILFVMAYDERSQIDTPCIAWANSAFNNTMYGIKRFFELGITPDKLVLGLPWYGYLYPCTKLTKDGKCYIPKVPYRGVNCSDAAGSEKDYTYLVNTLLPNSTSGSVWEESAKSPYFNYKNETSGQWYQIWYDNLKSLGLKYQAAQDADLRGVGMWAADSIDYTNTTTGAKQRAQMWGALPDYKKISSPTKHNGIFKKGENDVLK